MLVTFSICMNGLRIFDRCGIIDIRDGLAVMRSLS